MSLEGSGAGAGAASVGGGAMLGLLLSVMGGPTWSLTVVPGSPDRVKEGSAGLGKGC